MEFRDRASQTAVTQAQQAGVNRGRYSQDEKNLLALLGYNTDGTRNTLGLISQAMSSVDIGSFGLGDNIKEHMAQEFLRGDEGEAIRSQGYKDLQARDRELQAQQYANSFEIMQQVWGMAAGGGSGSGGGGSMGNIAGMVGQMGVTTDPAQQQGMPVTSDQSPIADKEIKLDTSATSKYISEATGQSRNQMNNQMAQQMMAESESPKTSSEIAKWGNQLPSLVGSVTAAVGNAVAQNELSVEKDEYITNYLSNLKRSLVLDDSEYVI